MDRRQSLRRKMLLHFSALIIFVVAVVVLGGFYNRSQFENLVTNVYKLIAVSKAKDAARVVDGVADELGATSSQVALAWVLATPGVTSPIVGISRMEQWQENVKALDLELSEQQYSAISEAGLNVWAEFSDDDAMWGWKPK